MDIKDRVSAEMYEAIEEFIRHDYQQMKELMEAHGFDVPPFGEDELEAMCLEFIESLEVDADGRAMITEEELENRSAAEAELDLGMAAMGLLSEIKTVSELEEQGRLLDMTPEEWNEKIFNGVDQEMVDRILEERGKGC